MATEEDIASLSNMSKEELIEILHNGIPSKRSAAAIRLAAAADDVTDELLLQLSKEKALYTRIAICESLQGGNIETARKLIKYLGVIGSNQYKSPPNKVSAKKSYPLPRDIIARSLGKMNIEVFPKLMEVLKSNDLSKICEILDAIGYMVFYNPILATSENCNNIIFLALQHKTNPIILWKAILSLSAFPCKESKEFLLSFAEDKSILGMEASRSLGILEYRDGV